MLDVRSRQHQLHQSAPPPGPGPAGLIGAGTVAEALAARADDARRAYVEGATGASRTWAEVAAGAGVWAALLRRIAARAPGVVGLCLDDPLELIEAVLGALRAGVGVTTLDPSATAEELERKGRALPLAAVVVAPADEAGAARVPAGAEVWCRATGGARLVRPRTGPSPALRGTPSGLVLTSSGTTGPPKVVALGEAKLLGTARQVVARHGLTPDDCGYSTLPLFHVNGLVVGVLAALVGGHRLVVDRRFSASRYWDVVAREQVTWLNLVPAMLAVLASAPAPPFAARRRVAFARSASAPLPVATLRAFEARTGILVVETYGMTEAASQITANPRGEHERRVGSVGRPAGTEVRVVDDLGAPVADGVTGSVEIRGSNVITDYLDPTGAPRPACGAGGWLPTGDLGHLDADGYLYLEGRADDVINRAGEKIHPREIEEALLGDPAVAAAAVVGRADPVLGQVPVAFVVAAPTARADLAGRLARRCETTMSRHRRPVDITVVDALPAGPTGKVRRGELRRCARPAPSLDLDLPERSTKPRRAGLTMVIDSGLPEAAFEDAVASAAAYIDLVKFGWGTALVTASLDRKVAVLRDHGIRYHVGGTLFEKFVIQDRFEGFVELCRRIGADTVEVSNGTIPLSNTAKAAYIRKCSDEFEVISEVGFKDTDRSLRLAPSQWVDCIREDLDAGATHVITEARESGSSGICRADGELRLGLIEDILASGIPPERLIFEAPTKALQTAFVERVGPDVNLGNIRPADVIGLETLRLGLRADTLMHFETRGRSAGRREEPDA